MVKVDTLPSGFSGSQWTQQGRPVSEAYSRPSARLQLGSASAPPPNLLAHCKSQPRLQQGGHARLSSTPSLVAVPAYDLHRMTEGPTLYLNGPPDVGIKSSLSTNVDHMHHGKFMMGQLSRDLTSPKVACHKSKVGPDPYNVNISNPWHQRSSSLKFSVEGGESRSYRAPRPVCARSMNLDPYSVSSRDNSWGNFGRTSTAAKAYRSAVSPSRQTSTAHGSARSASTYYFSPFPESLGVGSRAHTPRIR